MKSIKKLTDNFIREITERTPSNFLTNADEEDLHDLVFTCLVYGFLTGLFLILFFIAIINLLMP